MPFNKETASEAGKKSTRKGVPNKFNAEKREALDDLFSRLLHDINKDLEGLEVSEKLSAVVRLLPYYLPKKKEIDITIDEDPVARWEALTKEDKLKALGYDHQEGID